MNCNECQYIRQSQALEAVSCGHPEHKGKWRPLTNGRHAPKDPPDWCPRLPAPDPDPAVSWPIEAQRMEMMSRLILKHGWHIRTAFLMAAELEAEAVKNFIRTGYLLEERRTRTVRRRPFQAARPELEGET